MDVFTTTTLCFEILRLYVKDLTYRKYGFLDSVAGHLPRITINGSAYTTLKTLWWMCVRNSSQSNAKFHCHNLNWKTFWCCFLLKIRAKLIAEKLISACDVKHVRVQCNVVFTLCLAMYYPLKAQRESVAYHQRVFTSA